MTLDAEPVYFFHSDHAVNFPEAIMFGDFSISFYGICLVIAALIGIVIIVLEAKRQKHEPEAYLSVLCLVFLFGGIGARVFYVLFHWDFFQKNLWWALELRTGGLSFYGALFGAWIAVREYCKRKDINLHAMTDVLGIAASVASVPVWIGCMLQKEPLGKFYNGMFSVRIRTEYIYQHNSHFPTENMGAFTKLIDGNYYTSTHPVAVYGLLLCVLIALVIQAAKRYSFGEGNLFVLYLFLAALQNLILSFTMLESGNFFGIRIPIVTIVSAVLLGTILIRGILGYLKKGIQKKNKLF